MILVIAEHRDGKLNRATLETIAAAQAAGPSTGLGAGGGPIKVAVLGTVMNSRYLEGIATLRTALPQLPDDIYLGISNSIQAAHMIASNPKVPAQFADTIRGTANQAFVSGMNDAMLIGAAIMALNAVIVVLVLPSRIRRSEEHAAPATALPMTSHLEPDGAAD